MILSFFYLFCVCLHFFFFFFFFFNDTATTEIYTLSLHDALPIYERSDIRGTDAGFSACGQPFRMPPTGPDRKSTRLNSSHSQISYAVFCLKKKKKKQKKTTKKKKKIQ